MPYKNKKEEEYHKNYRKKNRLWTIQKKRDYKLKHPWIDSYKGAKQRCTNPNNQDYKNYGKKGIKFLLSKEDIEKLWFRDKAYLMDRATIDRIDNDGNYEYDNCQFLENIINSTKDLVFIEVHQYDKNMNLITTHKNQTDASRNTGVNQGSISDCVNKNRKYAGGYVWKQFNKGN